MSNQTTSSDVTGLSEDEFIAKCLSDMMQGWIPLKTYLRMYPDESKRAVEARLQRKYWQHRVHYFCPKGSLPWVNLPAIHRYVSGEDCPEPIIKKEGDDVAGQALSE